MLHRYVSGSGPAQVFLHGWGLHGGVWRGIAESLAASREVTLLDLPGHGHSDMTSDYTLESLAAEVERTLPASRIDLVGWSLGGMVAIALALAAPARVRRLVLVGSSPRFVAGDDWRHAMSTDTLDAFAHQLREDHAATVSRFLALQVLGCPDARSTLARLKEALAAAPAPDPRALERGLAILRERSLLSRLSELSLPVTLIHGERDTIAPLAGAEETAARLPNARLHVIRGAGHAPFLSHAARFRELLEGTDVE